ncbi:MAG: hypothetical protein K0U16_07420 [Gammaproteobacteria bacterium]|nr:hypothetical protein [Gammaproteobacteria bacterium]
MKLSLADYEDPKFNPGSTEYHPISGVGDEFLENAILDPALFASRSGLGVDALSRELTRMGLVDSMRQQQFVIFSMGKRVGITQPFLNATRQALGFIDIDIPQMKIKSIETTVFETGVGIAAGALSAIPNIYTQIIAAVLNFGRSLAHWAIDLFGGDATIAKLVTPLLPVQGYSDETDAEVFNRDVLPFMRSAQDWSRFFAPRYKGQLSGTMRVNGAGQRSIGWALGNGSVPRAIYEGGDNWRIDQDDSPFLGSGGLGFIPGGQRIYGVLQTTAAKDQIGPHKSHKAVYNRNCAGIE